MGDFLKSYFNLVFKRIFKSFIPRPRLSRPHPLPGFGYIDRASRSDVLLSSSKPPIELLRPCQNKTEYPTLERKLTAGDVRSYFYFIIIKSLPTVCSFLWLAQTMELSKSKLVKNCFVHQVTSGLKNPHTVQWSLKSWCPFQFKNTHINSLMNSTWIAFEWKVTGNWQAFK